MFVCLFVCYWSRRRCIIRLLCSILTLRTVHFGYVRLGCKRVSILFLADGQVGKDKRAQDKRKTPAHLRSTVYSMCIFVPFVVLSKVDGAWGNLFRLVESRETCQIKFGFQFILQWTAVFCVSASSSLSRTITKSSTCQSFNSDGVVGVIVVVGGGGGVFFFTR